MTTTLTGYPSLLTDKDRVDIEERKLVEESQNKTHGFPPSPVYGRSTEISDPPYLDVPLSEQGYVPPPAIPPAEYAAHFGRPNAEVIELIDKLQAAGVRSYRDGDLVIEFERKLGPVGRRVNEDTTIVDEARARGIL